MKKVSFIISLLNRNTKIQDLISCLDSISSQKEVSTEILVFTTFDGPIVLEGALKEAFDRNNVTHRNYPNRTFGALRNLAIEEATGDYVCFINPSGFVVRNSLIKMLELNEDGASDIIVGQSMDYDAKNKTLTPRKEHEELNINPIQMTVEEGMISPELMKDYVLSNKLFKLDFLKKNQLYFSDTDYYNHVLFQLMALIQAKSISVNSTHFHNERVYSGLDKLTYPTMELEINEQQVQDLVAVFDDIYRLNEIVEIDAVHQMLVNLYVKFVFSRGLNYLNITGEKEALFKTLAEPLSKLNLSSIKESKRRIKILNFLKNNDLAGYTQFIVDEKKQKEIKKNKKVCLKRDLFSKLYKLSAKLPVSKKQVLFISHSPGMDGNYEYIQNAIKEYNGQVKRGERFSCKTASTKSSSLQKLFLPFKMARAEFILAAEFVPFFHLIDFREDTKVVQTWHAAGAFKKFGHSTSYLPGGPNPFKNTKMHLHSGYDYATVSSEDVRKHYADAFRMDVEKVIPIGLPRADFFFNEEAVANVQNKIYELYPALKGKKVILYAPTFRGVGKTRANFEMEFDCNEIARKISDDYVIALKLHPSVQSSDIVIEEDVAHKVIDLSPYKDANDVLTVTDMLITDYSSIIFDYSLLNKPMVFYAYDLEEYRYDRDFYYEYEEFVPGPIAKTNEEIIEIINNHEFDLDKVKAFSEQFFVSQDGTNSKRFVEEVLVKLSK